MDLAHRGDLLALQNPTAAPQVRLQDRRGAGPEDGGKLGHRGQALAGGHRDGGASGHPGHALEIVRGYRFLEPEWVVGLEAAG